jgi:hypothetical protein
MSGFQWGCWFVSELVVVLVIFLEDASPFVSDKKRGIVVSIAHF